MKKLLIALAATAIIGVSPAYAQSSSQAANAPPSTKDMRHRNLNGNFQREYDSRVLLGQKGGSQFVRADDVAKCLARRDKAAGELVGGSMAGDPEYGKLVKALSTRYSRCAGEEAAGVPMMLISGALAEELVKAKNPSLDDRAKAVNVNAAETFYTDARGRSIETVGRCLAVYSPGLAMKVLKAAPATPVEKSALASLYSQTPECGVPSAPSDFSADEQRSAVAAGLYHWLARS